jgi:hypothetical protein
MTEPTQSQLKLSRFVNAVVNDVIETPIQTLIEKTKDVTMDQLLERIHALTAELIKVQFEMREHAVVEWYQDELDDLRKHLHCVFERNRAFFKTGSRGQNWVSIMTTNPQRVEGFEEFLGGEEDDQGPYYFKYYKNNEDMNGTIDKMRLRDTHKMLCVPMFKA